MKHENKVLKSRPSFKISYHLFLLNSLTQEKIEIFFLSVHIYCYPIQFFISQISFTWSMQQSKDRF